MARQVQLQCGSTTLALNDATYILQAANGWLDDGDQLGMLILLKGTTLTTIERALAPVVQMINRAELYSRDGLGDPVYVRTKTCDALSGTAELGSTWRRKRVLGGSVEIDPLTGTAAAPDVRIRVRLVVQPVWQRAAPAAVLEASAASSVTVRSDGGLTVAAGATLTARRVSWSAGAGFTVRVRWLYSDNDCTFFSAGSGTPAKAYYQASDNKLYIQDTLGTTAASSALSVTAGTELDLVFKWDPLTPYKAIWVNGTLNGYSAFCVLSFTLGSELITNGGFETHTGTADDGTSDTFTGWSNAYVNDGAGSKIEATTTAQEGSKAVKLSRTTGMPTALFSTPITATPGHSYKLQFYTRGDGAQAGMYTLRLYNTITGASLDFYNESTGVTGTTYTVVTRYAYCPPGYNSIFPILRAPSAAAGTAYFDAVSLKRNQEPDTFTVFAPYTAAQTLLSWQLWPEALTDAECAGLYAGGRPEPELAYTVAPADDKATNAVYPLYNVPGHNNAALRLVLASSGGQDFAQVLAGLQPYRLPTMLYECESGAMGTNTAINSNAAASGGSQARYTPADTAWATRVTITLAYTPLNAGQLIGNHRLYLAGYDSAASVQVNRLKWRLVIGGHAGEWSDELAFAAVATRSLLDLGELTIPPGNWPEETLAAATNEYESAYIQLQIQTANSTGSGGGTLDMDAIYLAPAAQEGRATATFDVSDIALLLDWTGDAAAALGVQDGRSLEFGGWGAWEGDDLAAPAIYGTSGKLWLYWLRSAAEEAYPNDTCDVAVLLAPRWRYS